ncbi:putative NADH-ubiquinone oxidoreductase B18 subunit [Syncephalis fuscata]|nr:putative NADH-ubiquinone oxidoreductase B18 subunit [Syncephalis fuscata]
MADSNPRRIPVPEPANDDLHPRMSASREDMKKNRVPLEWRDYCAHKLIPLNNCRYETCFMPWKCEEERHAYEKCQYDDYKRRMRLATKIREEQKHETA